MSEIVTLTVKLEVGTRLDGDQYVAHCPSLDLFSQGSTQQEAIGSLKEAIEGWFESCIQRGILEQALSEVGFKATGTKNLAGPRSTERSHSDSKEFLEVSIPAYIAAA